jgi:hypothetical protein
VDYTPARDQDTPAGARQTYRVLEDTHLPAGPRKSDPPLEARRILVHSTGDAKGQQRARDKRLAKAREDLDNLQHSAGGRYYNTAEKIAARIGVITKTRRVSGCPHTEITTGETGRPALSWHFDQDVLQAEAAVGGWYALLTTLTPQQADPSEVLRRHKGRGAVERRYGDFKGPLAVTPIFVQDNKRVAALIAVICLALLLFCLIERQVRRALGSEQKMQGLYPGSQQVRPWKRHVREVESGLPVPGQAGVPRAEFDPARNSMAEREAAKAAKVAELTAAGQPASAVTIRRMRARYRGPGVSSCQRAGARRLPGLAQAAAPSPRGQGAGA